MKEKDEKMRIALVTTFPPGKGSLNEYAYHFVRALRRKPEVSEVILLVDELPAGESYPTPAELAEEGAAPLTVRFTDTSTYTPTAWLWTFGDDDTSTAQHPLHIYTVPGTYTVTLSVSNDHGSDEASRS